MPRSSHWILAVVFGAATFGLLASSTRSCAQQGESDLVGKPAADLKGDFAVNGKPVSLSDLKGKVVVLEFWAVWCGPCQATFPHLKKWHDAHKNNKNNNKDEVVIIGVTTYYDYTFDKVKQKAVAAPNGLAPKDEQAMLKDFADHHKLKYLLMTLPEEDWKKARADYRVEGIPTTVLIDQNGKIKMMKESSDEGVFQELEEGIQELLKKQ